MTALPSARAAGELKQAFGRHASGAAEAPGRVNLIGEHLDYNGGLALPVAIDRTLQVAWAPRGDRLVRVYDAGFDGTAELDLDRLGRWTEQPWAKYIAGVAWALEDAGSRLRGVDMAIASDVPRGSGLSSSAALEVATLAAFRAASGIALSDRDLALLGQRAENEFADVACGIMDQFASALCREGSALLIDSAALAVEHVPLPLEDSGLALVVAHTGLPRRLAASEYNLRRQECERAASLLSDLTGRGGAPLAAFAPDDIEQHGGALPENLRKRARHVATEQARVRRTVELLRQASQSVDVVRSFVEIGELLDESHRSLRGDFEVSCAELDVLCELSRSYAGTLGARLTGAGFGGATVSLVREGALAGFEDAVMRPYRQRTGLDGWWFATPACGGLRTWEVA